MGQIFVTFSEHLNFILTFATDVGSDYQDFFLLFENSLNCSTMFNSDLLT